ncbi:S49 family peptidase, partial [Methylophaga sp.]|uniref:sodium:solute symporter family transporter n=1 Tax=Methylophaga sp. TaxID=2024840 RepID=UPI00175C8F81
APKIKEKNFLSIPDHFRSSYGERVGVISALLITFLASPAPYILSMGVMLQFLFGIDLGISLLISTVFSVVYVWNGGFSAVVKTDILQFILMFAGFFLLVGFSWSNFGSPLELIQSTPGSHLDPFLPMKESDLKHAHQMLDTIHQQFIDVVKAGRGDRLAKDDNLFSGLFWSGEQAVNLGLIDGLANTSTVARDMLGAEDIVDYTPRPNYLDQFAGKLGASISQFVSEKASWSVN